MKNRVLIGFILFSVVGTADAASVLRKQRQAEQKFSRDAGGTFVLDNPVGDVDITGADVTEVTATIVTTITAANEAAFQEGQKQSGLLVGGATKTRVVRTAAVAPIYRQTPWSISVRWIIRVPKSASVRVASYSSRTIRISNLLG